MSDKKVLLITGGSTGIGAATARLAVAAGWCVGLSARSTDKLDALVTELGPERALAVGCDVTDFAEQQRMVSGVVDRFGGIDAVFANAGVGGQAGGFSHAPVESWKAIVDTNILGVAYTLRATLEAVKARQGHVLITGSRAGRVALRGSMYSASKWAVTAMGYALREELEGTGVRVTLIEPGMVDTPFFDTPKPHALKAEDVARSVMYALDQPAHAMVHEILVIPTPQAKKS